MTPHLPPRSIVGAGMLAGAMRPAVALAERVERLRATGMPERLIVQAKDEARTHPTMSISEALDRAESRWRAERANA